MAVILKNPHLTDYFLEVAGVRASTPLSEISPVTAPYEAAKVIYFPDLKFEIDFDFWSRFPSDKYRGLKKLGSIATADSKVGDGFLDKFLSRLPSDKYRGLKKLASIVMPDSKVRDDLLDSGLAYAALPAGLEKQLRAQIRHLFDQAIPIYERLFGHYKFVRRHAVWRLMEIHSENLHVDTYREEHPDHFARLFINLDVQPRIWQTSYTIEEIFERYVGRLPPEVMQSGTGKTVWEELNKAAFGAKNKKNVFEANSRTWWDRQPRHVAYFEPGAVWAVDSRQVAHQIFYGRRAVSIDFTVDPASMQQPQKQYLQMARDFQRRVASGSIRLGAN
jgi:hypothetical protein